MASPLIISVSGLRGEIGQTLTPDVVMRYVLAYSAVAKDHRPFVVTRDGRRSGAIYADIIHAALNAAGYSTLDGGVAATPTTGILVRQYNAAGGIQISASHNPPQYNGLKLFSSQGRVIPAVDGAVVLKKYHDLENTSPAWVSVDNLGKRSQIDDTIARHLDIVLKTVDVDLIRKRKFRVLLDSNHGAGALLGRKLLEALGCDFILCGEEPNGYFSHTPEPIVDNLGSIFDKVKEAGVDIGFCQDPDADRLAVIDANGQYLGEEYTMALCARNILQKSQDRAEDRTLVINCASSRMSIDIAAEFGGQCLRSPVGEANVVDLMLEKNALFGGEGNGGPIDPRVGLVRDSFVGMANILEAMARNENTVAELAKEFPGYAIVKRKRPLDPALLPTVLNALQVKYSTLECSRQDGLRIDWPNAWVLIRASNTEPVIRIIAEAATENEANKLCEAVEAVIKDLEN